ncbi:uncharacterized protein J4E92_004137 [Alternaria infectoria]|uniref:uncharacterized protein n=1 Tax=Alternaria infectoria TaxID=45303 RepID=UPI00221F4D02|nr:uncharacterized protein J4E92_004137 [Alternaria infectoria]KAI4932237.1 hypothetical protein J4E92_004137 [Alternaria infectoria]
MFAERPIWTMSEVEQKIDGLVAKLVHAADSEVTTDSANASQPIPREIAAERWRSRGVVNTAPGSWMPTPAYEPNAVPPDQSTDDASESAEVDRQYLEEIRTIHRFDDREDVPNSREGIFRASKRPEAPIEHEVVQQLLTSGEADTLLIEYRNMSATVAAGLQKPNLLKHTSTMTEWAQSLKQDREYETDETISLLIALRQIDDQVQDELFTADTSQLPMSDGRALMHVRFIDVQLDTWKRECNGVPSQRLLELSFSYAKMQLHSVALRPSPSELPASVRSSQINSLLSALEASKRFLDTLLSFPAHEYHLISFSEWMRLPPVIMTVAKLCIPSEDHAAIGWDTEAAQERVRLDLCLESLCYRMQTLSTFDKTKRPHPDFWHAMRMINELTKNWYIRKIRPERPSQTPSGSTPSDSVERSMSGSSCPITSAPTTCPTRHAEDQYNTLAGTNYMEDFGIDMNHVPVTEVSNDPFALMRGADFDMSQFFDMAGGIWGEDSYNNYTGMSFGNGAPF